MELQEVKQRRGSGSSPQGLDILVCDNTEAMNQRSVSPYHGPLNCDQ